VTSPSDTRPAGRPVRLVILARPDPIQIWTTNRVAALVPVTAVLSETGRTFTDRHRRRFRTLIRKNGLAGALDRYLDLAYFKWRTRRDGHDATIDRVLGPGASRGGWAPGLEVHEVDSVNAPESVALLRRLAPDLVFCNGASILKPPVIAIPPLGTINIHTGVVPEYRGPAPEFWALHDGAFDMVGVTVHMLTEGIDDGDVLLERRTEVRPGDNEISLRCKNVQAGAELVAEAVRQVAEGAAHPRPQDPARAATRPRRSRRAHRVMLRRLREIPPAGTGQAS